MSPASSGTLEVERYIGACLISSRYGKDVYHHHQRNNYGWAGGAPLISFTNQRRVRPQVEEIPLARLQGAPLVLSNRFNRRRNKPNKAPPVNEPAKDVGQDAVSVASDESSGNSETCLPRIIKPRKRRKKDRKAPPPLGRPLSQDGFSTESPSPDIIDSLPLRPYFPEVFGDVLSETPKLHHRFEDVKEAEDVNGNQPTISCQCSYCDPSNLIWDVDRNCYSPFLTTPVFKGPPVAPVRKVRAEAPPDDSFCLVHSMSSISLEEDGEKPRAAFGRDLEVSTEIVTSANGHRDIEIKFFLPSSLESEVFGGTKTRFECFAAEE